MQRIRDEAHRFAHGYNELLYRKRMRESALDDAPGMSLSLIHICNVRPMFMPKSSPLRRRSSRMKPRFITMHNTENPAADAMQHARCLLYTSRCV